MIDCRSWWPYKRLKVIPIPGSLVTKCNWQYYARPECCNCDPFQEVHWFLLTNELSSWLKLIVKFCILVTKWKHGDIIVTPLCFTQWTSSDRPRIQGRFKAHYCQGIIFSYFWISLNQVLNWGWNGSFSFIFAVACLGIIRSELDLNQELEMVSGEDFYQLR